jgi:hypothetical protein
MFQNKSTNPDTNMSINETFDQEVIINERGRLIAALSIHFGIPVFKVKRGTKTTEAYILRLLSIFSYCRKKE